MKTNIKNLHEALIYQVQQLYAAEEKLKRALPKMLSSITSETLSNILEEYRLRTEDRLLKLERVFHYVMFEPGHKRNSAVDEMLNEAKGFVKHMQQEELRDIMIIAALQNVINYKEGAYRNAHCLAAELEMDTPAELLNEINQWEKEADQKLYTIISSEVDELSAKNSEELIS